MNQKKTLIIVRHGKSSWEDDNLADMDRHLTNRGVDNAYGMARRLEKIGAVPERIITSFAARALHTSVIFAREMGIPFSELSISEDLYFTTIEALLNMVRSSSDEISSLMIFGHNPTFTTFANQFLKREIDNIPTTGVVILSFNCDNWSDISKKNLKKEYFDFPKNKS